MDIIEILQVGYKTVICYFFLLIVLKIMGKREIGKISTFDIVVFFVISELFSLSLNEPDHSILRSLIPVAIIVFLQLGSALLSMWFPKVRRSLEGKMTYIIYKGEIVQEEMRKQRYTIEDLMMQLRTKDVESPAEVEYAILETNGVLNIIKKDQCDFVSPDPLIMDGKVNKTTLLRLGKDEKWLEEELQKTNHQARNIFLALYMKSGIYVVPLKKGDNINKVK